MPSDEETALAESFIVLFVAELESYCEWVIESALQAFEDGLLSSGLAECAGATPYVERIREKRTALAKNNNANWDKISHFFEFVGLNKAKFPEDFWDDIEAVVRERGSIVHKSLGLRTVADPRLVIARIEKTLSKLGIFDRDFSFWLSVRTLELQRLRTANLAFQPGLGSIATAAPQ